MTQRIFGLRRLLPLSLAWSAASFGAPGDTELISVLHDAPIVSTDPNGESGEPSFSADGRYVAFASNATNFIAGDTGVPEEFSAILVQDRVTGAMIRVSVDPDGNPGNDRSFRPSISADGRYVAFWSDASNLVSDDTNFVSDVFVRDLTTGETTCVSLASGGTQGNDASYRPSISADGRYVAFASDANNLVSGDTNGATDVFVKDRSTGATTRVSVASGGVQSNGLSRQPSISADGRYVAFESFAGNLVSGDTNHVADIFVHDRSTGETVRASVDSAGAQGSQYSSDASISADGRFVAFSSGSTFASGDTNGEGDVFVHDLGTGETTRVSVELQGVLGTAFLSGYPSISADGRYVAFTSHTDTLVVGDTNGEQDVFVRDRAAGITTRVSVGSGGVQGDLDSREELSISADGRYVAFRSWARNLVTGDTNVVSDIFVHDRSAGETTRIGVAPYDAYVGHSFSEVEREGVSSDGRYIAFESNVDHLVAGDSNNTTDIFVRDRSTGVTVLVSSDSAGVQANGTSEDAAISADGRYVAFSSAANNLASGDTNDANDVFVKDRSTGATTRLSVASGGAQGSGASRRPSISADGRYVAFESYAGNLVSGDTNNETDLFVHDRSTGETVLVSVDSSGLQGDASSLQASISADGRYVAFLSHAANLVSGDTNDDGDVFVHDLATGETILVGPFGFDPAISGNGRYVAFWSYASTLVSGDTNDRPDVFVHDLSTGETTLVSVNTAGLQGDGDSFAPAISADGRFVEFQSDATNLVGDDTNLSRTDVFVRDRISGETTLVSVDSAGVQANLTTGSRGASISANGAFVAFTSYATNLTPSTPDTNIFSDVFLHEVGTANSAPTAKSRSVLTAEDESLSLLLRGTDPAGDALSFAIFDSPRHGLLTGTPPRVTYTPDPDFNGRDRFTFTVSDGLLTSAPGTIRIAVTPVNDAPSAKPQARRTAKNTPVRIRLAGFDVDRDKLTYAIAGRPRFGTLSGRPPYLLYTPREGFVGFDSFTFTVSDGNATSAPAKVRLLVKPRTGGHGPGGE